VAAPVVLAPSVDKARQAALEALSHIRFEGMHFRSDLGYGIDARLFAANDDAGSASP
jgi:phosphoribosylamine-glycine ligase